MNERRVSGGNYVFFGGPALVKLRPRSWGAGARTC
jgi:hypothetical protein